MTKYVDFRQGKIRYTDSDSHLKNKGRVIVFLHGFLESLEMWRYYQNLPSHYRKICIDLPGHGRSDNFGYVHSMELMAESVHAVLITERIRKVVIVGHSMGGYTALAFAELYPDMMKGLLMYFSSASSDNVEKKRNRNRAIKLVEKSPKLLVKNSIPLLFAKHNIKKYEASISVLVKRAGKMGVQNIIAALGGMRDRVDREIVLKFAPYPVCFVAGELDPVIPVELLKRQAAISNDSCITILKNTGHMGFIENKRKTFLAVKTFLNGVYG